MAGLAYMTGPPGRPLRAGSSVNDIMGGMFGAIGALAALKERHTHRQGAGGAGRPVRELRAALGAAHAATSPDRRCIAADAGSHQCVGRVRPVRYRRMAEQVFLGVVTDTQWKRVRHGPFDLESETGAPIRALPAIRFACSHARGCCPALREIVEHYSAKELQDMFEREELALRADRASPSNCSPTRICSRAAVSPS